MKIRANKAIDHKRAATFFYELCSKTVPFNIILKLQINDDFSKHNQPAFKKYTGNTFLH